MSVENRPVLLRAHFVTVASEGRQSGWSGQNRLLCYHQGSPSLEHVPTPSLGGGGWYDHTLGSTATELKKEILSGLKDDVEKQKQWNETSGCLVSPEQPLPPAKGTELIADLKGSRKKERENNSKSGKYLSNVSSFHGHL